jgi:hypothetical protein
MLVRGKTICTFPRTVSPPSIFGSTSYPTLAKIGVLERTTSWLRGGATTDTDNRRMGALWKCLNRWLRGHASTETDTLAPTLCDSGGLVRCELLRDHTQSFLQSGRGIV